MEIASTVRKDIAGDHLVKGVLDDGAFRFVAGRLSESVGRACLMHGLKGPSAQVLSEALVSTAILASPIKTEEKYALSVYGKGLMRSLNTDIDHRGNLRGYIRTAPEAEWPEGVTPSDFLAPPGVMQITRSLPDQVVYQGITEFRLGAIGADIALHVSTSDQVETEVRIILDAGPGRAAGIVIQALPGTDLDLFVPVRERLDEFERSGWPVELIDDPVKLVETVLGPFKPYVLESVPVQYKCNCSRERVENIFRQMSADDLVTLLEPDGSAVASCHWCNAEYLFTPQEMDVFTGRQSPREDLPN